MFDYLRNDSNREILARKHATYQIRLMAAKALFFAALAVGIIIAVIKF
jgi:flagellar biosynthesis protein FliQ